MSKIHSNYPECDKLAAKQDERRIMTELLEFMEEDGIGLVKGYYDDAPEIPAMHHESKDDLVLRALGIDAKKLEKERQAMLASLPAGARH